MLAQAPGGIHYSMDYLDTPPQQPFGDFLGPMRLMFKRGDELQAEKNQTLQSPVINAKDEQQDGIGRETERAQYSLTRELVSKYFESNESRK